MSQEAVKNGGSYYEGIKVQSDHCKHQPLLINLRIGFIRKGQREKQLPKLNTAERLERGSSLYFATEYKMNNFSYKLW